MKEVYAEYVIVNINKYEMQKGNQSNALPLTEIMCLPLNYAHSLNIGTSENIEKYIYTFVLPLRINKSKLIGTSILCKIDEDRKIKPCKDKLNVEFYARCKNIAVVVQNYYNVAHTSKDKEMLNFLKDLLAKMLSNKLRQLIASKNNFALIIYGESSISKMYNRIDKGEDLIGIVESIKIIENSIINNNTNNDEKLNEF